MGLSTKTLRAWGPHNTRVQTPQHRVPPTLHMDICRGCSTTKGLQPTTEKWHHRRRVAVAAVHAARVVHAALTLSLQCAWYPQVALVVCEWKCVSECVSRVSELNGVTTGHRLWLGSGISVEDYPEFTCPVLLYTTQDVGLERGCCSDIDVLDSGRPTRQTIGHHQALHTDTSTQDTIVVCSGLVTGA